MKQELKELEDKINWERREIEDLLSFSILELEKWWQKKEVSSLKRIPSFHITGSIGKGSTLLILEGLLKRHGWRTGSFLSPHLVHPRERIRRDGKTISEAEFASLLQEILPETQNLTYFETLTALAFWTFFKNQVEVCLYEVGMGGKHDSTNLNPSHICLFTPITDEHLKALGGNLEAIALEKCGILKESTRIALSLQQNPAVLSVIESECQRKAIPLLLEGRDFSFWKQGSLGFFQGLGLPKPFSFPIPFPPEIHLANTGLALASFLVFQNLWQKEKKTWKETRPFSSFFSDSSCMAWEDLSFLSSLSLPGRMERIGEFLILDTAHHPDSFQALFQALEVHYPGRKWAGIFSFYKDKKIPQILAFLMPRMEKFAFLDGFSPRSASLDFMASLVSCPKKLLNIATLQEGLEWAQKEWFPKGMLLIAGSHSIVGAAKSLLELKKRNKDLHVPLNKDNQ
ncbi:MAG: hypothetical protein D6785_14555 [Planctomycetota bacterium]|nr:MAG: hypothetical protein D6785_14555 [Planctomycetota bacterium]